MDSIQIPDSCSAGQFKVMLQWIDDDQSLSDQNKQWLRSKLTEKYMVLVAKQAVQKGIQTKTLSLNTQKRQKTSDDFLPVNE